MVFFQIDHKDGAFVLSKMAMGCYYLIKFAGIECMTSHTGDDVMRINARLDDSYEKKLLAIRQATALSTSEIVKRALDLLYEKTTLTGRQKNQKLVEMLAGTAEGQEDLSVNYKEYLYQGWKEKHGIE
jgi:hypothetical protein